MATALQGVIQTGTLPQSPAHPQQEAPRPYTNQWGSYVPPAPAAPAPQYNAEANMTFGDVNRIAPDLINQAVTPHFQSYDARLSQLALDTVRTRNAPVFEKYGPEIDAYLVKVPLNQRTVDNLTTIVQIVRGNHVDEIARELAGPLAAEMAPTLRSNGSPLAQVASQEPKYTLQSDAIPQDWKDRAAAVGLTESAIDEFCRANEMDRKTFFSQFGTQAITEGSRG